MNSFRFTKMHGLGNSYIYVNQFEEKLPEERLAEIAVKVSSIHTGIGSDGMILICPSEKAPVKCGFLIMTVQKEKIAATAFAVWQSMHTNIS